MSRKWLAVSGAFGFVLVACSGGEGQGPGGDASFDAGTFPLPGDAQAGGEAGVPTGDASDAAQGCGALQGVARFTCAKDGNSRGKCAADTPDVEACTRGCLRAQSPAEDTCMGTTTTFKCTGTFGTEKAQNGDYFITSFGCWTDANNVVHTDPGDNCIPGCLTKAQSSGLCKGMTGPQCEEAVNWYVADSGRFGCLARLRVENPKNGKKVIVVALDAGPACWVEQKVSQAILDASGRVNDALFGTQHGWSDKALVHVVEVDPATPLGPVP